MSAEPYRDPGLRDSARALRLVILAARHTDPWRSLLAGVAAAGVAVGSVVSPILLKYLFDDITGPREHLPALTGALTAGAVMTVAFALVMVPLRMRVQESTGIYLEQRMMQTVAEFGDISYAEHPDLVDQIQFVRDHKYLLAGSVEAGVEALISLVRALFIATFLVKVHPGLLLLFPAAFPSIACAARMATAEDRHYRVTAEDRRRANHLYTVLTTARSSKELIVLGRMDWLAGLHEENLSRIEGGVVALRSKYAAISLAAWLPFAAVLYGFLVYIAQDIADGRKSVGDLIMVLSLALASEHAIGGLLGTARWTRGALSVVHRLWWIQSRQVGTVGRRELPASGPIELTGVSFSYPGRVVPAVDSISMKLPESGVIALVGENGAGKSTLVKLLLGMYPVGGISVGGVPLADAAPRGWSLLTSAAFQDACRFSVTLREAVALGALEREVPHEEIVEALDLAGGSDLPSKLGSGLDTALGLEVEEGTDLSGGEWQRVALARAVLRSDVRLLVMDEPAAALDAEVEHALLGRLQAIRRQRSGLTVLVSHRLAAVQAADVIVVVADGIVAEAGSHDELMASEGRYARLYRLQQDGYRA